MNNEIPERIYHDPYIGTFGYEECEGDTVYIREDIVQGLVEALAFLLTCKHGEFCDNYREAERKARAALARMKEEG